MPNDVPSEKEGGPASFDRLAGALRGFGPIGVVAFLIIQLAGPPWFRGLLVLAWVHWSRTPWCDIGYVKPRSWLGDAVVGVVFGAVFKLVMKALVMPLLWADPINHAYHYVVGNPAALPGMLFAVTISAGFGEETVFRGYTFERLGKLFGNWKGATVTIVILSAAWFGIVHYPDQGIPGVEQAIIVGLVFGMIFTMTRRIWMLMVAHAAFDLVALGIIYWDMESRVAHLVFK